MSCARCPSGVLSGILWPVWPDDRSAPDGWSWIQRCHACGRYRDDEAAALALQDIGFGTRFQWFDRHTQEPHDRRVDGSCSLAIDFPEHWRSSPRFARPRDAATVAPQSSDR